MLGKERMLFFIIFLVFSSAAVFFVLFSNLALFVNDFVSESINLNFIKNEQDCICTTGAKIC